MTDKESHGRPPGDDGAEIVDAAKVVEVVGGDKTQMVQEKKRQEFESESAEQRILVQQHNNQTVSDVDTNSQEQAQTQAQLQWQSQLQLQAQKQWQEQWQSQLQLQRQWQEQWQSQLQAQAQLQAQLQQQWQELVAKLVAILVEVGKR